MKIKVTPDILEGLQQMSHKFHQGIYADTTSLYGKQEQKYIDELLTFSYKIVQTIGIVAGFGFTAVGFVNSIILFVMGEALLIGSIVYGIFNLKKIYTKTLSTLKNSSDKKIKALKAMSDLFRTVILDAVKTRMVDLEDFDLKHQEMNENILKEFEGKPEKERDETKFLTVLLVLLILGGMLLLTSFLDINLFHLPRRTIYFSPKFYYHK